MVKIFTDIDLDGLGCGVIAKIAFGEHAKVSYCSYRNLNQRVDAFISNHENDKEDTYITDLAVNSEIEKKLSQRHLAGKHIRVIDHHVTAMHFNQYEWGSVIPEYENGKKTCATSLFYDYLVQHEMLERNQTLEEFIDLVRQYDTWEWDENNNLAAKRLNDLFYIMNREQFEEEMIKRIMENSGPFTFTDTETTILDIEEKKIHRYIQSKSRQIVQTFIEGYCIGIVHAEQHLSELGNALNNLNPHLDMIALLNVGSKKIGFRTIHDEINVAEFAKRFGGGGHPKASGAELTNTAFEDFVVKVFDVQPLKPDADRNEFNIRESSLVSSYRNQKGDISFILPGNQGNFSIVHKGKCLEQNFPSYTEAERFIKRNYLSWLRYDQEFLEQLSSSFSISIGELKENYPEMISNRIVDLING